MPKGAFVAASIASAVLMATLPAYGQAPEAQAQGSGNITIELNRLEDVENACRVYLLIQNDTSLNLTGAIIELVSFNAEGVIGQRLSVDLAPLRPNKTVVKLFDLPETSCGDMNRLLLNDALVCEGEGGSVDDCLGLLVPSSRASATFWK
jgi:hypothetical protein